MKKQRRIQTTVSKGSGSIINKGDRKRMIDPTAKEKTTNGIESDRFREIKTLITENKFKAAIELCVELLNDDPDNAGGWFLLGTAHLKTGRLFEGVAVLTYAISLDPNNAIAHYNLAQNLSILGKFDELEAHLRKALALQPDYAECYQLLADTQRLSSTDPLFENARSIAQNKSASEWRRRCAAFAVASVLDRERKADEAIRFFQIGNAQVPPNENALRRFQTLADRSKAFFTPERIERLSIRAAGKPAPIFIVGMPRSGTTLLERILSAHPAIGGAGELPDIFNMAYSLDRVKSKSKYPDVLEKISPDILKTYSKQYLNRLRSFSSKTTYVIDKNPLNFFCIGFIRILFPHANIIHIKRNPLDVAISCFQSNFTTGHEWAFSFDGIARFYKIYADIMEFWENVIRPDFYTIDYENIVRRPQEEIPRLIRATGLDWDDACLTPERRKGNIDTASKWQARQPISSGSIDRWKRYESTLEPLRQEFSRLGLI